MSRHNSIYLLVLLLIAILTTDVGCKRDDACKHDEIETIANAFALLKADNSKCPDEKWLYSFKEADPKADKVVLDIGFNKGYFFAKFASVWAPELGVNPQIWYKALHAVTHLKRFGSRLTCGVCEDCKDVVSNERPTTNSHDELLTTELKMFGVDLNVWNANSLANITGYLNAHLNIKLDIGTVIAACGAVSNGTVEVLSCPDGWEACTIKTAGLTRAKSIKKTINVPMMAVDDIVDAMLADGRLAMRSGLSASDKIVRLSQIPHGSSPLIDFLLIDTEGNDPRVLQGAKELLRHRLVRVVEFEYHEFCPWPLYSLQKVVHELYQVGSYVCYIAGQGRLWRMTGESIRSKCCVCDTVTFCYVNLPHCLLLIYV